MARLQKTGSVPSSVGQQSLIANFQRQSSSHGSGCAVGVAPIIGHFQQQQQQQVQNNHYVVACLPPAAKVDYSMSRDGPRFWAVVFVFVFLCSSLYALFNANELTDLASNNADGIEHFKDMDEEIEDEEEDSMYRHKRSLAEKIPPAKINPESGSVWDTGGSSRSVRERASTEISDDDDEDASEVSVEDNNEAVMEENDDYDNRLPGESELFGLLRAKIESKIHQKSQREDTTSKEFSDSSIIDDKNQEEKADPDEITGNHMAKFPEKISSKRARKDRVKIEDKFSDDEVPFTDVSEESTVCAKKSGRKAKCDGKNQLAKDSSSCQAGSTICDQKELEQSPAENENEEEEDKSTGKTTTKITSKITISADNDVIEATRDVKKDRAKRRGTTGGRHYTPIPRKEDIQDCDRLDLDKTDGTAENQSTTTEIVSVKKTRWQYRRRAITNHKDNKFRDILDSADYLVEKHEMERAFDLYGQVLMVSNYPDSPRAHFGMARAYDILSERGKSNSLLEKAIGQYEFTMQNVDTPDELFRQAGEKLADRARFRGWLHKTIRAQMTLIDRFPTEIRLKNDLGTTFLVMGRDGDAKKVFANVLTADPLNGYAQAHYGFILKVYNDDIEEGVVYMRKGLKSKAEGTRDARLYYHLGDGLQRLGRAAEAYRIYEEAADLGIFPSKWQRSVYNVEGLTARPWWSLDQTTYGRQLKSIEKQWTSIRDEVSALINTDQDTPANKKNKNDAKNLKNNYEEQQEKMSAKSRIFVNNEEDRLTESGQWLQLTLYARGQRNEMNCRKVPKTCDILMSFKAATTCRRGQIKLSLLTGGGRVRPHCGPTNTRLRGHLGLILAPNEARIRVANETRAWKRGRFLVFDDSFEHEVWHDGQTDRLILIVDMWHPELTAEQRRVLGPI